MVRVLLLLLCLLPAWPGAVFADSEQDEARAALERGEIKPLDRVLAAVRAAVPGDVVAVKLERKKSWVYSLKILTPAGKRREVKIDAASLAIVDSDDDDDDDD